MEINSGDSELDKKIAEWLSLDQVNMLFGMNCWIQGNVFAFCLLRMMRHTYMFSSLLAPKDTSSLKCLLHCVTKRVS